MLILYIKLKHKFSCWPNWLGVLEVGLHWWTGCSCEVSLVGISPTWQRLPAAVTGVRDFLCSALLCGLLLYSFHHGLGHLHVPLSWTTSLLCSSSVDSSVTTFVSAGSSAAGWHRIQLGHHSVTIMQCIYLFGANRNFTIASRTFISTHSIPADHFKEAVYNPQSSPIKHSWTHTVTFKPF